MRSRRAAQATQRDPRTSPGNPGCERAPFVSSFLSGVGLASGLNLSQIIESMLAVDARRKTPLSQRSTQITSARSAMQQLMSRLLALQTSNSALASSTLFSGAAVTSSQPTSVLASIIAGSSATAGHLDLMVRQLARASSVTSGALDPSTALGITAVDIRTGGGSLVEDRRLADLNGGQGVPRGWLKITDRAGSVATVDLRAAVSVQDVLDAINGATGIQVEARIGGPGRGGLELIDTSGGNGTLRVDEHLGGTTAAGLGLLGVDLDADGLLQGATLTSLGAASRLSSIPGGVPIAATGPDFSIIVDGQAVAVSLRMPDGSRPVTLGQALGRINDALQANAIDSVSVSIDPDGTRLRVASAGHSVSFEPAPPPPGASAAANAVSALGLDAAVIEGGGSAAGARLAFGLDDVPLRLLNAGTGLQLGDTLELTDGAGRSVTLGGLQSATTVQELLAAIRDGVASQAPPGMSIAVGLDSSGTRITLRDQGSGSGALTVGGSAAASLGFAARAPAGGGIARQVQSADLGRATVGWGTTLADLAAMRGATLGDSGTIRITTRNGQTATVDLAQTGGDVAGLARAVAATGLPVEVRLSPAGDSIQIVDVSGAEGGSPLVVSDEQGSVAALLGVAGQSTDGVVDGTRRTRLEFTGAETLSELAAAINAADAGITATIVNIGAGQSHLVLTSTATGLRQQSLVAMEGADPELQVTARAADARVLLQPSQGAGILVERSSNAITGLLDGVRLDLVGASESVISIDVSPDHSGAASTIRTFANALLDAVSQLRSLTAVDASGETRGPLYGDPAVGRARESLRRLIGSSFGPAARRLSSIGISIGADGLPTIDDAKLQAAIDQDPEGVAAMLAGDTGVQARFAALLDGLVDPDAGSLPADDERLSRLAASVEQRIDAIDRAIARRRTLLQARFNAMETAIERLNRQQSTLSTLLSQLSGGTS